MLVTEMKQRMRADFEDKFRILTGTAEQEQQWQDYFQGICQRLLGPQINLEEHPIRFCVSDRNSVNAFYLPPQKPLPNKFYLPEELEEFEHQIPCIIIYKGMLEAVQNEDQLAFFLGHELGHWKTDVFDTKDTETHENTKLEEETADIQSLQMMADSGYNINEAYKISEGFLHSEKLNNADEIITRSLDHHLNNEDRLLAIGTTIRQLDVEYAVKGIDLDSYSTHDIPLEFQEEIKQKHHVSQIKKDLRSLGYYDVPLAEKQDILFNYLNTVLASRDIDEGWYLSLLKDVLQEHILELMHNIPRTIVRQSDYNLLTQRLSKDELQKLKPLWQQIVGKQYDYEFNSFYRKDVLDAFPYKVVPDDVYEQEHAEQEEKRKLFYRQIDSEQNLNVLFWNQLMDWAAHGYAKDLFLSCAGLPLSVVPQIDLTKTSFGRWTNSFFNEEQRVFVELMSYSIHSIRESDFSLLPTEFLPFEIQNPYHCLQHIFYRFTPNSFPELDLEMSENDCQKSMPRCCFVSYLSDSFGVREINYIGPSTIVSYVPHNRDPFNRKNAEWCYVIENGKIVDSFPYQNKEKTWERVRSRHKYQFQKAVADHIKDVYGMLMKIKENYQTHGLNAHQLRLVKSFTSPGAFFKISSSAAQQYFDTLNDEQNVSYTGRDRKKQIMAFFRSQGNSGYLFDFETFYDEDLLKTFLTEEERAFFFDGYNADNDNLVFQALRAGHFENPEEFKWLLACGDNFCWFSEYVEIENGYDHLHTNRQVLQYLHDYLNQLSTDEIQKQTQLQQRVFDVEWRNLHYFVEKQLEENPQLTGADVDFSSYSYLILDEMAEKLGVPIHFSDYSIAEHGIHKGKVDFRWNNRIAEILKKNKIADKGMNINRYNIQSFMLIMYILTDETHTLPLSEIFIDQDIIYSLLPYPCLEEKLLPFLYHRKNYSTDSVEALKTFSNIIRPLRKSTAPIFNVALDIVLDEKDIQKSLEAAVLFAQSLQYYPDIRLVNPLKDKLCANLAVFQKDVPLEIRIDAYLRLNAEKGFSDDYVIQNQLLNSFLDEIQKIDNPQIRNQFYTHFILLKNRIVDPDIRRTYQKRWVESVFEVCGSRIDDNSSKLHEKISGYLSVLHGKTTSKKYEDNGLDVNFDENNVAVADQYEIARLLADKFVSQEELSFMIEPQVSNPLTQSKGSLKQEHYQIVAWDTVKYTISHNPSEAKLLMDFLLSDGTLAACEAYRTHLESIVLYPPSSKSFQVFYREFWQYPLEVRSVLLCSILGSASRTEDVDNSNRWEAMFNIVAPRIFSNSENPLHQSARSFLYSYIKSRKPNERGLYLAAMLVAANGNKNIADPDKCMAVGIRLFLENSGPAAIKLGQAMASCPEVPRFIREELDCLKSQAARPARWELYKWLREYQQNGDDTLDFGPSVWLGNILGAASYFVTLEQGQMDDENHAQTSDKVIKILRGGAQELAKEEFGIFESTLIDLAQKNFFSDNLDTFIRLVQQAKESSHIETNLDIGYAQLETAQNLYEGRQIAVDGHIFDLHVCDWTKRGKNWAVLERANGTDLKKITDLAYKQSVSKAYFTVELMNILSGSRFDHDRHGEQLKINTETNTVQLFDTGAMAVVDPTPQDKQVLGRVVYRIMQRSIDEQTEQLAIGNVAKILVEEIDKVYKTGEIIGPYLTEFQRGLLALKDFYNNLTPNDIIACFNTALNQDDMPVDKNILAGFVREGIRSIGIFETSYPLLSEENKEILGRVLFTASAIGMSSDKHSIQDVLNFAVCRMKEQHGEHPLLNIISTKISQDNHIVGLDLPKELIPTIQEMISDESYLDTSILKGAVKEIIETVNLQEQKDNYSSEDRQAFGRLLYDAYLLTQNNTSVNLTEAFLQAQKSGQHRTELGCKMAAIVRIIQSFADNDTTNGIRTEDIVRATLLSGHMDTEITKGIVEQFEKTSTGNQFKRSLTAKGLQWFLSQEKKEMGFVKRMLRWKLGVKKEALMSAEDMIMEKLANRDLQRSLTESVKKIICDFVGDFMPKGLVTDNTVAITPMENPQTDIVSGQSHPPKKTRKFLTLFSQGRKS